MNLMIDTNFLIPSGSELRVLLNSEHISSGEVFSALKSKGVFCGDADKSITVPLLSAMLLTSSGYSALIESSVDRDSKPKIKVSALDLVAVDSDWINPLKQLFGTDFDPFVKMGSIEVVEPLGVVVDGKDRIRISYTIIRKDFSKDWIQRELKFSGEISIERQKKNLKLDFSATHSSRETEEINRRVISKISKTLKDSGVTASDIEQRITFDGFSNIERVRFFKRLTAGYERTILKGRVNDMEISRDIAGPPLPDDPQVSWMNQTVKRIKIDGEKLNDIFLISDEKYYPFYHVQRINVTFPYKFAVNSGEFSVAFFFSTPSRSSSAKNDADLTFEIPKITHNNEVNRDSKNDVNKTITKQVRGLIELEFEKIVSERISQTSENGGIEIAKA